MYLLGVVSAQAAHQTPSKTACTSSVRLIWLHLTPLVRIKVLSTLLILMFFHKHTKHIEIDCHFISHYLQHNSFYLQFGSLKINLPTCSSNLFYLLIFAILFTNLLSWSLLSCLVFEGGCQHISIVIIIMYIHLGLNYGLNQNKSINLISRIITTFVCSIYTHIQELVLLNFSFIFIYDVT